MKTLLNRILALGLALTLTACAAGGVAPATGLSDTVSTGLTGVETTGAAAPGASVAEALAAHRQINAAADDAVWSEAAAVAITLNGDSIAASGAGVTVAGSRATITQAGTYVLSGVLTDGQIVVDTAEAGVVQLVLNGVDVSSALSAPLYIANAERAVILLAEGSRNTLTDAAVYQLASPESDEPNAALFSTADLTIAGDGALTVNGRYNDGIASKDGLLITGGTLTVNAADDGLRGKDYLVIQNGALTLTAQGDGLKADNAEDAALGYIAIEAGEIAITAGGDAITAQTDVLITGGTFTLTTGGGSASPAAEAVSAKGIKATTSVTIEGGTFSIDAADDALHANGSLVISGGEFHLATGDDGLHADAALTINAGEITVTKSYEGLESAVITLNGGALTLTASDDGVNVASGVDGSGARPGMGGQVDGFTYTGSEYLYINGGTLVVEAGGDGLDVNGAAVMTGGLVVVNGPTAQMNGAVDYDAGFAITGGTLVAAGSAGMAQAPDGSSSQASVLIYFSAPQPAGTLVHVRNSAGETVLTFAPTKDFQSLAFSSPALITGATYEVYTGGVATGEALGGLAVEGTYTPGALYTTFTIANTVTQIGAGGGGFGRRP